VQSDPMNIIDDPPFMPKKPSLNVERPPIHPFNENNRNHMDGLHDDRGKSGPSRPRDGADTLALEKHINAHVSDSIEDFSDEERVVREAKFQKGSVKEKVRKIERIPGPHIDFRIMHKPLKSNMKRKVNRSVLLHDAISYSQQNGNNDPIATSSSFPKAIPSLSSNAAQPTQTISAKTAPPIIHIKEFFLGTEHKNSKHGYHLRWDTKNITIREGELGFHTDMFQMSFAVATELETLKVFNP
jgi:hypothetical protein